MKSAVTRLLFVQPQGCETRPSLFRYRSTEATKATVKPVTPRTLHITLGLGVIGADLVLLAYLLGWFAPAVPSSPPSSAPDAAAPSPSLPDQRPIETPTWPI
jgi:hypothetical protein